MHVEVETRGEFTRGETVANRRNELSKTCCTAIIVIEGLEQVKPNVQVAGRGIERFMQLFISRVQGK